MSFAQGSNVTINVTANNPSTITAYIKAWLDTNGNGVFDAGEAVTATVAAGAAKPAA